MILRSREIINFVQLHDLRHTQISHLLLNGVHPKVASERAGHAAVGIPRDTYSHVLPGLQEGAAAGIDSMLRTALEQLPRGSGPGWVAAGLQIGPQHGLKTRIFALSY